MDAARHRGGMKMADLRRRTVPSVCSELRRSGLIIAMDPNVALRMLDILEHRQYRRTGKPTRPGELAARRRDPVSAVANQISQELVIELFSEEPPSRRAELKHG